MVTFTILLVTLLILAIAVTLIIGASGLGFFLVFSDVIVCMAIIWLIVRAIIGLRK